MMVATIRFFMKVIPPTQYSWLRLILSPNLVKAQPASHSMGRPAFERLLHAFSPLLRPIRLTEPMGRCRILHQMKHMILIALLLIASGAGKAVAICAGSSCRMKAMACCCRSHEQKRENMTTPLMNSEVSSQVPVTTLIRAIYNCCPVASAPKKHPGETSQRLILDNLKESSERAVPLGSGGLLSRSGFSVPAVVFYQECSDTYLHTATLRI